MRIVLIILSCVFWCNTALAAGKVALVIGNGAYQNANKLPNPVNDATDMAAMLKSLGFVVISGTDLDHETMVARIGEFEEAAQTADTALFFYAGHGMQVDGQNYLIPVNAKLERKSSLQFEAIDSEVLYRAMTAPGRTAIIFLDACRDSPLSRRFANISKSTRSTAAAPGLAAPSTAGGGLFIGFATNPNDVAADGEGRNSPFTTALLKFMPTPGLEIQQMMTRVKANVFESTRETQEPWHNSSLRNEVYLGGEAVAVQQQVPEKQSKPESEPTVSSSIEVEWNAVKQTASMAVLDAFIAAHGNNPVFVALAEDRKGEINRKNNSDLLDSFKIVKKPEPQNDINPILESLKLPETPEPEPSAKADIRKEAFNKIDQVLNGAHAGVKKRNVGSWNLGSFFDVGIAANGGQGVYALLGPTTIELTPPVKNPGTKSRSMKIQQIATAPSMDALLGTNADVAFSAEKTTQCRLDWIDRCPYLSAGMVQGLTAAMAAKGLDITNHDGNYYMLSRITNSEDYLLSNAPDFRDGTVAIVAAVIAPDMTVKDIYGFDLSKSKLGLEAGAPESGVEVTGAAVNDDEFYISFDGSQRCTDKARRYGFIAKFTQSDHSLKWVSPLNVSDANLLFSQGRLLSSNGGSCVEDFLYDINMETGAINTRAKLPSAVDRMDERDGRVTLDLYDSAGIYQLP